MNPIPYDDLRLILLLGTLTLFVTYGALLWVCVALTRRRERGQCGNVPQEVPR